MRLIVVEGKKQGSRRESTDVIVVVVISPGFTTHPDQTHLSQSTQPFTILLESDVFPLKRRPWVQTPTGFTEMILNGLPIPPQLGFAYEEFPTIRKLSSSRRV